MKTPPLTLSPTPPLPGTPFAKSAAATLKLAKEGMAGMPDFLLAADGSSLPEVTQKKNRGSSPFQSIQNEFNIRRSAFQRARYWILLPFSLFAASAGSMAITETARSFQSSPAAVFPAETGEARKLDSVQAKQLIGIIIGGFLTLFLGVCTLQDWMSYKKIKELFDNANRFSVRRREESDPVRNRLSRFLETQCRELVQQIALQARHAPQPPSEYNHPVLTESRALFQDPTQLQRLFQYIAYQWVVTEEGGTKRTGDEPVSNLDFLVKQYTLMTTALKSGMILNLLQEAPEREKFKQSLNLEMLPTLSAVHTNVQHQLNQVAPLIAQELMLESLITEAQLAIQPIQMGSLPAKHEVDEVARLTQQLESLRQKTVQQLQQVNLTCTTQESALDQLLTTEQRVRLKECALNMLAAVEESEASTVLDKLMTAQQIQETVDEQAMKGFTA